MKDRDFIDTDLARGGGPSNDELPLAADSVEEGEVTVRSVSDFNLGRLAKHRQNVNTGVVGTINEIETLRLRQQELEQEKKDLEELSRKQEEYVRGKREILEHLNEGIVVLEKKEIQSAQLTELVNATRTRFAEALEEIEKIDEEQWPEERFREELYKALVIVDDARMEYNKALAKIEVLEGSRDHLLEAVRMQNPTTEPVAAVEHGFGYWLKVGVAVTIPFALFIVLLIAVLILLARHTAVM